jgi:peroxidase
MHSNLDKIMQLGGPDWDVKLGRRDAKTASFSAANSGVIPPPSSNLTDLIKRYRAQGLSPKDLVALSGKPHNSLNVFLFVWET